MCAADRSVLVRGRLVDWMQDAVEELCSMKLSSVVDTAKVRANLYAYWRNAKRVKPWLQCQRRLISWTSSNSTQTYLRHVMTGEHAKYEPLVAGDPEQEGSL